MQVPSIRARENLAEGTVRVSGVEGRQERE